MMTLEGKAAVTKNLKRESVLKSGGYAFLRSGIAQACYGCTTGRHCSEYDHDEKRCKAVENFECRMEEEIMSLPHIVESDRLLVKRLCRNAAFLFITDEWLSKTSPFSIDGSKLDFQPLLVNRVAQERLVIRLSSQLGLNPEARARIGLNMVHARSLAQAFSEVNQYEEE